MTELLKDENNNPLIFKVFPLVLRVFPEYTCNPDGTVSYDETKCKGLIHLMEKNKKWIKDNRKLVDSINEQIHNCVQKLYT